MLLLNATAHDVIVQGTVIPSKGGTTPYPLFPAPQKDTLIITSKKVCRSRSNERGDLRYMCEGKVTSW